MTESSSKTVNWGIIGAGRIARGAIAPAIIKSSSSDLVAVGSRADERAKALASELGASRSYGTYEALLEDQDLDAIYIGLPNGLHEEWAIRALEAGKHVLCDKSLTFTAASARRIRDTAKKHGLLVMEGFMYRHHPQWRVVREWMREGSIGQLRAIRGTFCGLHDDPSDHRWTDTLGKGALYDLTCYPINAARYLTGEEPDRVSAFADWDQPEVDNSTEVSLHFPSGVTASVLGSFVCHSYQRVEVFGSAGRITVERPWGPGTDAVRLTLTTSEGDKSLDVPGADQFAEQIRHFANCLVKGELTLPAEDGVANVTACEAAALSAQQGKVVVL